MGALAGAVGLGLAAPAGRGSAPPAGLTLYRGAALAFGTTVSVSVLHHERRQAELAIDEALGAARQVDRLMSIYSPASQVFRLNRDGVLRDPDPHLLKVLAQARQLSQWSEGAFDVTVQPLWQVFRSAAERAGLPSATERGRALALVGWRDLQFDRREVRLRRAGMALTLNGLAQGYAADRALAALRARGVAHALLDTGEFIAAGRPSAQRPWTLGIRDPRRADALAATVQLSGRSLATSGDYACAFTPDLAHHHIFDTARGDSPAELASVTVAAPSALLADGLSTAFMAMGGQRARALAARLPGVDLLTIDKRGAQWRSPGFPAVA